MRKNKIHSGRKRPEEAKMIMSATVANPAVLSRLGLLEASMKMAVALDSVMGNVGQIGGVDRLRLVMLIGDGYFFLPGFGLPLSLVCRVVDWTGSNLTGKGYAHARLYLRKDEASAEVWAILDDSSREEFHDQDTDPIVQKLSEAILKSLRSQFP